MAAAAPTESNPFAGPASEQYFFARIPRNLFFALRPEALVEPHEENFLERLGNRGLYVITEVPKRTWRTLTDPRFNTIVATLLCNYWWSQSLYPDQTERLTQTIRSYLPTITLEDLRFPVWLVGVETISSFGLRAYGRFTNTELFNRYYYGVEPGDQEPAAPPAPADAAIPDPARLDIARLAAAGSDRAEG